MRRSRIAQRNFGPVRGGQLLVTFSQLAMQRGNFRIGCLIGHKAFLMGAHRVVSAVRHRLPRNVSFSRSATRRAEITNAQTFIFGELPPQTGGGELPGSRQRATQHGRRSRCRSASQTFFSCHNGEERSRSVELLHRTTRSGRLWRISLSRGASAADLASPYLYHRAVCLELGRD